MDLETLTKLDLKDIDIKELLRKLQQSPDLLLNIVLIICTIFLIMHSFTKQNSEKKALEQKLATLHQKTIAILAYEQGEKKLADFLNTLTPGIVEINTIIDKLNAFANNRNLQILAFTPSIGDSTDYYNEAQITLNIATKNFKDIGFFIHDIENADANFIVTEWNLDYKNDWRNEKTY